MKTFRLYAALLAALLMLPACGPDDPNDPNNPGTPDKEQSEYPKTLLLEQFTSESCVNCPTGVMQIDEYLAGHPQTIWLAHHAGYGQDQWTISASTALANYLGINGAPTVSLDRANYGVQGSSIAYHPYYLAGAAGLPTTTYASINISSACEGQQATIHVNGNIAKGHNEQLRLTVAIKENGLHGKQMDPLYTLAGQWEDYVHSSTIRAFVSSTLGDSITPSKGQYSADYTFTLDEGWTAENCMVVAFLADANGLNIVQAAEVPVVAGTNGGADIQHGGITPKAVPDDYPEGRYSLTDFIQADTLVLEEARAFCNPLDGGLLEWHINAWSNTQSYGTGSKKFIPLCDIIFFTDGTVNEIPHSGEMTFRVARTVEQITAGNAWAGYCDIEAQRIYGSEIDMVNYEAFQMGEINIGANGRWLIAENNVIRFTETGFTLDGSSASGKPIHLVFNGDYER